MADQVTALPGTAGDPSQRSSESQAMEPDWSLINDILEGVRTFRKNSQTYLPMFEQESAAAYAKRVASAPWRPVFENIVRTLGSKPFGKPVQIKNATPPDEIAGPLDPTTNERTGGLVDNIDGRGNSLTVFCREWFAKAVANGLHAVLVDFPPLNPDGTVIRTVADDQKDGARPYWVQINAIDILACYTDFVGGREIITHFRYRETVIQKNGFSETKLNRVRVFEPGYWAIWEEQQQVASAGQASATVWVQVDEGILSRGNTKSGDVPIVLFFTGERSGDFMVKPPLAQLAQMQIELFQALSREERVLTFAGSPMLSANGMEKDPVGGDPVVGPGRILYAPAVEGGKVGWEYIQPEAANITAVSGKVDSISDAMLNLGMQPMLAKTSGNQTATGEAIDSAAAHSAVKAWALMLNDAIQQAFVLTCEYLSLPASIITAVSTDFSVVPFQQAALNALLSARQNKDISQPTYLNGLKRLDVLPEDLDPATEAALIAEELEKFEDEVPMDPVTGQPLVIPRGATLV